MKYSEWVTKYNGKADDFDGAYGVQCVDLAKSFIKRVLGIEPQAIGNAIDYYNKRNSIKYLTDNFTWIDYAVNLDFKAGDLVVFKTNSKNGHIAVCNGVETSTYFESYDQNYNGAGSAMQLNQHKFSDATHKVLGVLRPKNQSNIDVTEVKKMATSKSKGSVCTAIKCNATMKSAQTVYVDNLKTQKAGSVSKGERVRALTNGKTYSIIQYGTSSKGYKAGIVPTNSITRD
jgi:hypothetical protein